MLFNKGSFDALAKTMLICAGLVVNCSNIRKATVNFLGKQKEILTKFLIPISGAVPCPSLLVIISCVI